MLDGRHGRSGQIRLLQCKESQSSWRPVHLFVPPYFPDNLPRQCQVGDDSVVGWMMASLVHRLVSVLTRSRTWTRWHALPRVHRHCVAEDWNVFADIGCCYHVLRTVVALLGLRGFSFTRSKAAVSSLILLRHGGQQESSTDARYAQVLRCRFLCGALSDAAGCCHSGDPSMGAAGAVLCCDACRRMTVQLRAMYTEVD